MLTPTSELRQAAKELRKLFPLRRKVIIRRRKLVDWGRCYIPEKGAIRITINKDLPVGLVAYTLAEEYAHAVVMLNNLDINEGDHGPSWGLLYAKCMEVILPLLENLKKNS